ncbi:CHAT domain-containing protein, partial [candidate division KSB1 bacterium]
LIHSNRKEDLAVADNYIEIGRILRENSEFDNALQFFNKALQLRKKILGEQNPLVAENYNEISIAFDEKREYENALKYENFALKIKKESYGNKHYEVSKSYNNMGQIYLHNHDYKNALQFFQEALIANVPDFDEKDPVKNPISNNAYSKIYLTDILNNKAITLFNIYNEETESKEDLIMAMKTYDLTIEILNKLNLECRTKESKKIIEQQKNKTYKEAIGVAVKTNKLKAFEYTELEKSTKLVSEILNLSLIRFSSVPDSIQNSKITYNSDISLLNKFIEEEKKKQNPDYDKINYWQEQLSFLENSYNNLLEYIKDNHPDYYNFISNTDILDIETIQSNHLTKDNALIEYKIADSLLYIFATTKNDYEVFTKEIDSSFFNDIELIKESMKEVDFGHHTQEDLVQYVKSASNLYDILIKPLETYIHKKRLIILPDDKLNYLSFDALITEREKGTTDDYRSLPYLIRKYAVSYSSLSATFLFRYHNGRKNPSKNTLIAFAPIYDTNLISDSNYYNMFTPIPGVNEEVKKISGILHSDVYAGLQATKANFINHATSHNILHLAMHTLIFDNKPMFSQLAFTPVSDTMENNFLNIYEIFNMKFDANLVVLSACNTGYGAMQRGEGIISLSGGFLYAGVPSIIMTLWSVQDKSSAELMQNFYYFLSKGKSKDLALQQAKLEYLKNADPHKIHPYFWAGFVNLGDTSPLTKPPRNLYYILIFVLISILFFGYFYFTHKQRVKRKNI